MTEPVKLAVWACEVCPFMVSMEASGGSKDECYHPAQRRGVRLDLTGADDIPEKCPAREHPLIELEVQDG